MLLENNFMTNDIVDCEYKERIADHLVETGCYLIDLKKEKKDWYHWKSGIIAPCYCNCRGLISTIEPRKDIVECLSNSIRKNFPDAGCIAGMATAGIPWASLVGFILDLPVIYIRKMVKQHGVSNRIEGTVKNENIVIIDDLIASGKSIVDAIDVINNETQAKVIGIQSIVNWRFQNMFQALSQYQVHSLVSYEQVIESTLKHKMIESKEVQKLISFYRNPMEYIWD